MAKVTTVAIDGKFGEPIQEYLTPSFLKRSLFGWDTYFAEMWRDIEVTMKDIRKFVWDYATILIKPDAITMRHASRVIEWLRRDGFEVVIAKPIMLDRHVIRAIWRYQWNIATEERKDVVDSLLGLSNSLFLVLRSTSPSGIPATVHLTAKKGPADPSKRSREHLRAMLGNYSTLLNCVHTADDPADMIRELGIILNRTERLALLRGIDTRVFDWSMVDRELDVLHQKVAARDLGCEMLMKRIEKQLIGSSSNLGWRDRNALTDAWQEVVDGGQDAWQRVLLLSKVHGIELDPWDEASFATYHISCDIPDQECLLLSTKASDWMASRE